MAASLLACGLDSDRTILFRQSDVCTFLLKLSHLSNFLC